MSLHPSRRSFGFVLIEALIALVLIAVGLLAVSKLQVLSLSGSGEAKARSEAAALSQQELEVLRNLVWKAKFTGSPLADGTYTLTDVQGTNATFSMTYEVSTPDSTLDNRLLKLTTAWTDRIGNQSLYLNSLIAWDDPAGQGKAAVPIATSLISPTGQAERCTSSIAGCTGLTSTGTAGAEGTSIKTDGTKTYLYKNGVGLLYLPPDSQGLAQSFTTITGKVYFDQSVANNKIPSSAHVRVRLSSEGECVYNNTVGNTAGNSAGSGGFTYFKYTCYVGPGWYGNVGVVVDDAATSNEKSASVCVGDPGYNNGVSDGTLISPHSELAATRSYRGFKVSGSSYASTGMQGGHHYGINDDGASTLAEPYDGRPRPSDYHPNYYTSVASADATNYFEQNFLFTHLSGNNDSCKSKMSVGSVFTRNAGQYFCINPDNDSSATDYCPPIWPGFEDQVGSGSGSINYTLTVATSGTGGASGTVAITSPSAVTCGTGCTPSYASGTTVTLTATADSGSTFSSWSGCTSTSGTTCTITVSAATTVTATFATAAVTNTLTVTPAGTGTGSVTSDVGGISCGSTCSATYGSVTSVTLTAAPTNGSTFTGWGGACSGTGTCTVSVSGTTAVTATFAAAATHSAAVTKSGTGSGTVTSSPSGISCGSTCSASFSTGSSVTLTAAPVAGTTFAGWGGACSGTSTCTLTMSTDQTVTATFTLNAVCTTTIKGKAHASGDTVTSSSGTTCTTSTNNTNYTCSLSTPSGTAITLTDVSGSSTYTLTGLTASCGNQSNVNFP